MTYIVSSGALNSTHSLTHSNEFLKRRHVVSELKGHDGKD